MVTVVSQLENDENGESYKQRMDLCKLSHVVQRKK